MKVALKKIEIELQTYGSDKGKYIATVTFATDKASIRIEVSPAISNTILHECVDAVSAAVELASDNFRNDLREFVAHVPRLTNSTP